MAAFSSISALLLLQGVPWPFTGNSGGSHGLDALQIERLLVSPERDFDCVLVWSFSRLSRNARWFADLRRTMQVHGMKLVSVTESARRGAGVSLSDGLVFAEENLGAV